MCVCVHGYICQHDKTKTPDQNDLKLGIPVVLDSVSNPVDLEFKSQRSGTRGHHFELLAPLHICGTDAATKFKFCDKCTTDGY